jgi:hypothetical protein
MLWMRYANMLWMRSKFLPVHRALRETLSFTIERIKFFSTLL